MEKDKIPKNWWRDKLIEALEYYGGKATNLELKNYFLKNYSNFILKSIKESSINGSINGQLQFYSKSDGGKNYTKKYDLFYKKKRGLWYLKNNYKEELGLTNTNNDNNKLGLINSNNNVEKTAFLLKYLFLYIGSAVGISKLQDNYIVSSIIFLIFQYIFYLSLITRIKKLGFSMFFLILVYLPFISSILILFSPNFFTGYYTILALSSILISLISVLFLTFTKRNYNTNFKLNKIKYTIYFFTFILLLLGAVITFSILINPKA